MSINNKNINLEIEQISKIIAQIGNKNPFSLKQDYFDKLQPQILQKIGASNISNIPKTANYNTPKGYFNDFPKYVLFKIQESIKQENTIYNELITTAPFLNSISKSQVYKIPQNYFESLNINFKGQKQAKVASINKVKRIYYYAAAAIVTGFIAISTIIYFNTKKIDVDYNAGLQKTSIEEIYNYLETQPVIEYAFENNTTTEKDETLFFEETSDSDLDKFLKEQPETTENPYSDI